MRTLKKLFATSSKMNATEAEETGKTCANGYGAVNEEEPADNRPIANGVTKSHCTTDHSPTNATTSVQQSEEGGSAGGKIHASSGARLIRQHQVSEVYQTRPRPYDVRAEFVPKASFQSRYGRRIPIVLGDDNYINLQQCSTSTSACPQISKLDDGQSKSVPNNNIMIPEESISPSLALLSPSATSAFVTYNRRSGGGSHAPRISSPFSDSELQSNCGRAALKSHHKSLEAVTISADGIGGNVKLRGSSLVSFDTSGPGIIGREGGQEYFMDNVPKITARQASVDSVGSSLNGHGQLDQLTDLNTIYNATVHNFAVSPRRPLRQMDDGAHFALPNKKDYHSNRANSLALPAVQQKLSDHEQIDPEISTILRSGQIIRTIKDPISTPQQKMLHSFGGESKSPPMHMPIARRPNTIGQTAKLRRSLDDLINGIGDRSARKQSLTTAQGEAMPGGGKQLTKSQSVAVSYGMGMHSSSHNYVLQLATADTTPHNATTVPVSGNQLKNKKTGSIAHTGSSGESSTVSLSPGRDLSEASSNLSSACSLTPPQTNDNKSTNNNNYQSTNLSKSSPSLSTGVESSGVALNVGNKQMILGSKAIGPQVPNDPRLGHLDEHNSQNILHALTHFKSTFTSTTNNTGGGVEEGSKSNPQLDNYFAPSNSVNESGSLSSRSYKKKSAPAPPNSSRTYLIQEKSSTKEMQSCDDNPSNLLVPIPLASTASDLRLAKSRSTSGIPLIVAESTIPAGPQSAPLPSVDQSGHVVDIGVCNHLPGVMPIARSVSQDRNRDMLRRETAPGQIGRFSSLRRLLPKFDRQSSSDRQQNPLKKVGNRASINLGPTDSVLHKDNAIPTNGIPGLFHSLDDQCCAAEQLARQREVTVREICEMTSSTSALTNARRYRVKEEHTNGTPPRFGSGHRGVKPGGGGGSRYTSSHVNALKFKSASAHSLREEPSARTSPDRPVTRPPPVPPTTTANSLMPGRSFRSRLHEERGEDPKGSSDSSIFSYTNNVHKDRLQVRKSRLEEQVSERRKQMEEKYAQMALTHLSTLSFIAKHLTATNVKWNEEWSASLAPENLRFNDLRLTSDSPLMVKDTGVFYSAVLRKAIKTCGEHAAVNVMISPLKYSTSFPRTGHLNHQPFFLPVLAEFQEHLPAKLVRLTCLDRDAGYHATNGRHTDSCSEDGGSFADGSDGSASESCTVLCKVSVLPAQPLMSLDGWADATASRHHPLKQPTIHERETCFLLIQLITALKWLQSQGVEEVGSDLDGFVLMMPRNVSRNDDMLNGDYALPQLAILQDNFENDDAQNSVTSLHDFMNGGGCSGGKEHLSLCQCALAVLCALLHTEVPTQEILRDKHVPLFSRISVFSDGFQKVADILHQEKASSLTQAKSIVEHMYWVSCTSTPVSMGSFYPCSDSCGEILKMEALVNGNRSGNGQQSPITIGHVGRFESEFEARLYLDSERSKTVQKLVRYLVTQRKTLDIVEEYKVQYLLHVTVRQMYEASVTLDSTTDVIV